MACKYTGHMNVSLIYQVKEHFENIIGFSFQYKFIFQINKAEDIFPETHVTKVCNAIQKVRQTKKVF
jgi:hypothetical protein